MKQMKSGFVHLVGAGPGDPDLLTVKALRLIQNAQVVVYDRLLSAEILSLIPAACEKHFAGKQNGNHHLSQDEINALLVKLAHRGLNVLRLKGGDPFVFGRGSEEAIHLKQHNIEFDVVPGVTAATACSAYAGIPLTHRGMANSVRIITGHCRADLPLDTNWQDLLDPQTTLVVYMGLANIGQISQQLISAGRDPATPAALIQSGTTQQQESLRTTLAELPTQAKNFTSPALIIIGDVVNLAEHLQWFKQQQEHQSAVAYA